MSLIKEALDKVEQEKKGEGEAGEAVVQETEATGQGTNGSNRNFTVSMLVWSVIIVVLATFVGGQLAVLLMFLLR